MGPWHVFGGLTYDPDKHPRVPGSDTARHHVYRWLGDVHYRLGRQVDAGVVALEYQKRGWPHFHPLLRLSGGLQPGDLARLGQAWFEPHGFARLEVPASKSDVCAYAAKYLSKDLNKGDVIFWPLRGQLGNHQPALVAADRRPQLGGASRI